MKNPMHRREYISDRKMRFIFEVTPFQLLQAKAGDADFDLEDHRFCYSCERWFNAEYWIALIEDDKGHADFVCSNCSDFFDKLSSDDKTYYLNLCERAYDHYREELKWRLEEAA